MLIRLCFSLRRRQRIISFKMSYEIPAHRDEILDDIAALQVDPAISTVFEKMRVYSELLQEQYVSDVQINEIMNELDEEWRGLMHQTAVVTGIISFLPEHIVGKEGEPVRDFYDTQEVDFGGVLPLCLDTLYAVDQPDGSTADMYKYELGLRLIREGIAPDGTYVLMHGSAKLDEIVSIEFPNQMSVEGARKWLEYYVPEVIQDVDIALLAPSKEECEMVLRLKDMTMDISVPHDEKGSTLLRTMQALNIYTNSLFDFDKEVPYQLAVNGDAWQPSDDGLLLPAFIQGSTMSALNRIVWLAPEGEPDGAVRPHVAARFLGNTKDDPATEMYVPVDSVTSLKSYRYHYFVGYNEGM